MPVHPNQADERLDRHIAGLGEGLRGTRTPDVERKRAADVARIGAVQTVEGSGSDPAPTVSASDNTAASVQVSPSTLGQETGSSV
jgi:hypothetical protein